MTGKPRRIGLLIPAADPRSEADFHEHLPPGISFHTTRLYESEESTTSTRENLDEIIQSIPQAARLVALVDPELIVFSCTSGSVYKGKGWDMEVARMITDATGIPAITTATSVVKALKALGLSQVFMVTPYGEAMNRLEAEFLQAHGIEVREFTSLNCMMSKDLGKVTTDKIVETTFKNRTAIEQAGGLFISCTALPAFGVIECLEMTLEIPVVSSNQATLWNCLAHLKIDGSRISGGRLYQLRMSHQIGDDCTPNLAPAS